MNRKAFTLIELLVVIAIIAVLMGVLMPSLQRVKKQGQAVARQAHLKQMTLVVEMYTNDHDGSYHSETGSHQASERNSWVYAMRPYYAHEPEIRNCPAVNKFHSDGVRGGPLTGWGVFGEGAEAVVPGWAVKGDYGSYGWNWWLCNEYGNPDRRFWRNQYKIKNPSEVPQFVDAQWVDAKPVPTDRPPSKEFFVLEARNMGSFCVNRHQGRVNGCFADSSVRPIGLKELWELKWHTAWKEDRRTFVMSTDFWPEWMSTFRDYAPN